MPSSDHITPGGVIAQKLISGAAVLGGGGGPVVPSYNATILADNPVGFWPLDDPSGTTARDAATSPHPGVVTGGITFGAAGIGDGLTAAQFDGVSTTVLTTGLQATTANAPGISWEAWVFPVAGVNYYGVVTCNPPASNFGQPWDSYMDSTYRCQAFMNNTGLPFGTACVANQWNYLAATYDGTTTRTYLAGVSSSTGSSPQTSPATQVVKIGNRGDGVTAFKGSIAKAAVYNYILTPAQIAAHYAAQTHH